jgi:hypothetical protein
MRAGLRALAVLAACSALLPARGEGQEPASVARALLDEARLSAGIGDWETAAACVEAAKAQDPADSDILYLDALAEAKRSLPLDPALGSLDAALASGRFTYYSRRDASLLKAEILVRERRWKEALDALGAPGSPTVADPAYRMIRARALAGMGDSRSFAVEIWESLRRFPDDAAFARLFLARAGMAPDSPQSRAVGEAILSRLPSYAAIDPELPVLAAPLMPDIASRRDAVLAFRAGGGASAAATLRALEYGILGEAAAAAELLSGAYPVSIADLSSLMALAGSPAGRGAVGAALSAWSGKLLVDADSDGVPEGALALAKGLAVSWSADSRQAGVQDRSASFLDGLPKEIRSLRSGPEILIAYSTYPAVSTVSFTEKGERRSYSFGPDTLAYAPLAMRPFAGSGKSAVYLPYPADLPDPSERSCAAAALSVETSSGSSRQLTLLDRGQPLSSVAYEGDRERSRRSYEKGRPALELVDADGDGRFETERGFALREDGTWDVAWLRMDVDGDGVFEYREQTVVPFLKEWDYDGNGSVDARQYALGDGSIRREFSSRLDGRLDEAIVVRDGSILSLYRDGAALRLIPDSNRELTWIGRKIFDLGRNLPAGEGIYSYMGSRYVVTRVGSLAFAELVP